MQGNYKVKFTVSKFFPRGEYYVRGTYEMIAWYNSAFKLENALPD